MTATDRNRRSDADGWEPETVPELVMVPATPPPAAPAQPATPGQALRWAARRIVDTSNIDPHRASKARLQAIGKRLSEWAAELDAAPAAPEHQPGESVNTGNTYTADEGAEILADVKAHPKRDLIETIADATFDVANEDGTGAGGGMWHHLAQAHALVEALPALCLDEDSLCDEPGCGAHPGERVAMVEAAGPLSTSPPGGTEQP